MRLYFIRKQEASESDLLREQNALLRKMLVAQEALAVQLASQPAVVVQQQTNDAAPLVEDSSEDFSFDLPDEPVHIPTQKIQGEADLKTVQKSEAVFDEEEIQKLRRAKQAKS